MADKSAELFLELMLSDGDSNELDELTHQLESEIKDLSVDSIKQVSKGTVPGGTKAADWASIGQFAVTLAPTLIPPLFDLLRSWINRKPSTPVKIKVKVGKRTAQIEYDPTDISSEELEKLIKTLGKSTKG
jgi:hypothetical protein